MALIKKLAKQTALYGLSSIATRVLAFVFLTPFLTYHFSKEEMGIQTELYSWAAFLLIPFTYRLETALFRFGSKKEDLQSSFRTVGFSIIISTVIFTATLIFLTPKIAGLLEYENLQHYIVWLILIVALDALVSIPFAMLRLEEKAMSFASIKIINMLSYLGLVFFFVSVSPGLLDNNLLGARSWYNPNLGIGYVLIANLIANLITFLLLLKPYFGIFKKNEGELYFDFQLWKKMMQYAGPLIIVGLAGIINEVLDRSLLKFLLHGSLEERLAQVGIYGACYKIAIFMNLLTQAFNYAAEPFFFKNSTKNDSKQLYADIALLFTFLASIVFLGVMLFMNIFQYFVSAPFREGLHIVPVLLIANLFLGLYYNVSTWYKLTDKTNIGAIISIVGALVTILANILLIPVFGYSGAAWATLICYSAMLLMSYLTGKHHFPVPYSISRILFYIVLSLIIYFIHQYTNIIFDDSLLLSLSCSTFFLALFIVIILVMDGKYLLQILKK